MINFSRGDVILVDIAFTGAVGYKRRPAVVISENVFQVAAIKLIVAAIRRWLVIPARPDHSRPHSGATVTGWLAAELGIRHKNRSGPAPVLRN